MRPEERCSSACPHQTQFTFRSSDVPPARVLRSCYGTPGAAKAACDTGLRACILTTQCMRIPAQDIIHLEECRVNADTYYGLVRCAWSRRLPAPGSVHGLTVRVRRSDFGDAAFRVTQKDAEKYTAQCLAHAAAP